MHVQQSWAHRQLDRCSQTNWMYDLPYSSAHMSGKKIYGCKNRLGDPFLGQSSYKATNFACDVYNLLLRSWLLTGSVTSWVFLAVLCSPFIHIRFVLEGLLGCLHFYATPPTFLIWNNLCDLRNLDCTICGILVMWLRCLHTKHLPAAPC